jgi:Ca2+-binding RTX toxin-like protein
MQMLAAGSGNETLAAGGATGTDVFFAGNNGPTQPASTLIDMGSGNDTAVGGSGNATINAGSGADIFAFVNGETGGSDLIVGFNAAAGDRLTLQRYAPNALAPVLAAQVQTSGGTTITLPDNTQVTVVGINSLNNSVFV